MLPVERITISGFRGILTPIDLHFRKGGSIRSMAIYGRNGTGKSSITDAWEWFHSGKVDRLGREGAGPSSYPHRNASGGDTYVEVEFTDSSFGTVRLTFDRARITKPHPQGAIDAFRAIVPHPCHIRFEDLTHFVYLRKAEKYDALARLMGFTPQVDVQKCLRRTLRQLKEKLDTRQADVARIEEDLGNITGSAAANEQGLMEHFAAVLRRREMPDAVSVGDLHSALDRLKVQVEQDPRAQELAELEVLKKAVSEQQITGDTTAKLLAFVEKAEEFQAAERETLDLIRIGLYEQGKNVLEHRALSPGQEGDPERCPLCGQMYEGDLLQHVLDEMAALSALREVRDDLNSRRTHLTSLLAPLLTLAQRLSDSIAECGAAAHQFPLTELLEAAREVKEHAALLNRLLEVAPENFSVEHVQRLQLRAQAFSESAPAHAAKASEVAAAIDEREQMLSNDTARAEFVSDYYALKTALSHWSKLVPARRKHANLERVVSDLEVIVEDFVRSSSEDVESRFALISADVQRFFAILEEHSEGLASPTLKLLVDQDRAVMLEVEFRGERISPAYKYLSESQLNSFGLSVFLASARYFNPDFHFLLLDDVINSFDGYKRPLVIKLLKEEFVDYQILLLTHDDTWRDRLFEEFSQWVRQRFTRFGATGPVLAEGKSEMEKIEDYLADDEPVQAGRTMGPFLERQLQELCEAFEVYVPYTRRNEYTLKPLLERFAVRVKEKLKNGHDLYAAVAELQAESGFRNLTVHAKDPAVQLTAVEMQIVVTKWKQISSFVKCPEDNCYAFLKYDGNRGFVCNCRTTRLTRNE